jgi:hypothetical protein
MCENKENDYETWAQVLLIDDLKGTMNQKQKALITYLDETDTAVIQEVDIPVFEPLTVPSDCVKIAITNDEVEVIARKKSDYSVKNRFFYSRRPEATRELLFDNGILTITDYDSNFEFESMDFYNYEEIGDSIFVYGLGNPNESMGAFGGSLQKDTLKLDYEVYIKGSVYR